MVIRYKGTQSGMGVASTRVSFGGYLKGTRCLFPAPVGNDSVSVNGGEEKTSVIGAKYA